jgi:hypothetical protein
MSSVTSDVSKGGVYLLSSLLVKFTCEEGYL